MRTEPVPNRIVEPPPSPTEQKLLALRDMDRSQARELGLYPTRPTGDPVPMTPLEASAARNFFEGLRERDPDGRLQAGSEFIRAYKSGPDGRTAIPTGPLRHCPGFAAHLPASDLPPETRLVIHSHPNNSLSDAYPSRSDYLEANREGKLHSDYHEMLYDPKSRAFFRFDGRTYPPTYFETAFPP